MKIEIMRQHRTMKIKKLILPLSVVLGVVGIIFIISLVNTAGITGKVTNLQQGMDKMIQDMIQQRTKEITKQITEQITSGQTPAGGLPGGQIPGILPASTTTADVPCDLTPQPRQFSSTPYYTGPLLDAHLHMPAGFEIPAAVAQQVDWTAPVWDKDISTAEFICLLDREQSKMAIGFHIVPNIVPSMFVNAAKDLEKKYPGRVAHFVTPAHLTSIDLTPLQLEEILKANPGLFKGLGEYAWYRADYKGKSPEDPSFLKIYDLANKYKLIVMIHADEGQQAGLERVLQKYPQVTFLFHGSDYMSSYAGELVCKHPNAYFTIDGDLWDIPNDHQSVNLYGNENKEEFIADFKRDFEKVQGAALRQWKTAIEKCPDKFVWGTDRGKDWHFDQGVGALLEEGARSFIGQLDPAVQEKIAYQNAERLLKEQ